MSKKIFALIVSCFCIALLSQAKEPSQRERCDKAVKLMLADKYDEAEIILKKLTDEKCAEAFYHLGVLRYNTGKHAQAVECFQQASALGSYDGKYQLGLMKLSGTHTPKDLKGGVALLDEVITVIIDREKLYEIANAIAYHAGDAYKEYSRKAYKKAAEPDGEEKGHVRSQFILGAELKEEAENYKEELKPEKKDFKSMDEFLKQFEPTGKEKICQQMYYYLELAAMQDYSDAWFALGLCYEAGLGIPEPDLKRAKLCFLAAERCNPRNSIEFNIGLLSRRLGEHEDAKKYFRMAANANHTEAMYFTALYCEEDQNYQEARHYLNMALKHNVSPKHHIYNLIGSMDFHGYGAAPEPQNKIDAYDNFLKAAEDGSPDAMYQLSEMYRRGIAVSKDNAKADEYLKKAIATNIPFERKFVGDKYPVNEPEADKKSAKKPALDNAIANHMKKLEKMTGANLQDLLAQLAGNTTSDTPVEMIKVPTPASCKLAGWDFDPAKIEEQIDANLALSRSGDHCLKDENFDKYPVEENLAAPNPTIRYINHVSAQELTNYMESKKFAKCSPEVIKKYVQQVFGDDNTDKLQCKAWIINDNLHLLFIVDYSGRWNMHYYHFATKIGNIWIVLPGTSTLPTIDNAATANGFAMRDPHALNNICVELEDTYGRDFDSITTDLLLKAAKNGCPEAYYNLAVLYKKRRNDKESKKYSDLFEKAVKASKDVKKK
ncbi:MAG: sel1 repeat family protein [Lentisphaeria bacterium]|nr:sel1 repeat family protein [Lentisphaeria bacterium]